MKLSTKGRYGLRLMLDLASKYGNGQVFLKDIAKRIAVTDKYLWQIISQLKNAGLVISERGAKGGYSLSKDPSDITVKDIVLTLEGRPYSYDENTNGTRNIAKSIEQDIWKEIGDATLKALESITLQDALLRQTRKYGTDLASMYYI